MKTQGNHDRLASVVVGKGIQRSREHRDVDGDSTKDGGDDERTRTQSCFQVQEEEASDEDENAEDDGRSCLKEIAIDDLVRRRIADDGASC